jgi:hypothetical protein
LFVWGNGQVKGIVFNLLEEVVRSANREDARDSHRDAAGLHPDGDERCLLTIVLTPRSA